jgi:hypothetical protein
VDKDIDTSFEIPMNVELIWITLFNIYYKHNLDQKISTNELNIIKISLKDLFNINISDNILLEIITIRLLIYGFKKAIKNDIRFILMSKYLKDDEINLTKLYIL